MDDSWEEYIFSALPVPDSRGPVLLTFPRFEE
jgi:hypothetical protein